MQEPRHTFHEWAFVLEVSRARLSSVLTTPTTTAVGSALLLYPHLEERKSSHGVVTSLARALATRGIVCLRIDLPGSGHSAGSFELRHWRQQVTDAWRWLRQQTAARPALIGIRGGALLAANIAPELQPTGLVLWATPKDGERMVREWMQRKRVNEMSMYGSARSGRSQLLARLELGGPIDLDGHAMSPALYDELTGLTVPESAPAGCRTLTVQIGAATVPDVKPADTRKFASTPPFWNRVGLTNLSPVINDTGNWLREEMIADVARIPPKPDGPWLTLTAELVEIPSTDGILRGVLHAPEATPRADILLLHGWSGNATGPHNLLTHAAQQWAAKGYRCLQFDFRGRGDSDGSPPAASIQSMTDDAEAALEFLRSEDDTGGPVVLAAICSGCKVALTLTARRPEIQNLLLWSADTMGPLRAPSTSRRKTLSALSTYGRKLLQPESWRKILQGRVQTDMVRKALASGEKRTEEEAEQEQEVLDALKGRRASVLLIYGGKDPDTQTALPDYQEWFEQNGFSADAHVIEEANHSFYSLQWEQELIDASTNWLERL